VLELHRHEAISRVSEIERLAWPHRLSAAPAWRAWLEYGEELAAEGLVLAAVAWR